MIIFPWGELKYAQTAYHGLILIFSKPWTNAKRAKETRSKELWDEYKRLRNEVTRLLREEEANYWTKHNTESSKDFWKLVARIIHKKKLNKIGPISDDQANMILDDKNKAEAMNDCFVAVGPNLTSQINLIPYSQDTEHI